MTPDMPQATKEHQWLKQLVGSWTFRSECQTGPGEPPMTLSGTETTRAVGDLWVVGEMDGETPGGGMAKNFISLGFDPQKGKFVGTFITSMMPMLWLYEGELDAGGTILTLASEGPAFTGEGTALYHDIIEVTPDGGRIFSSQMKGPDGDWVTFMRMDYQRA